MVQSEIYDKHIKDSQAILINPPWDSINVFGTKNKLRSSNQKTKNRISICEFCKDFKISTDVMKDGLVFIWVEKEYIYKLIKFFEAQNFSYVENMCYVMLDQNLKEDLDRTRESNINKSLV